MQGFLALISYYRCFIKNYERIAQPLTDLLKKEQAVEFRWADDAQATFQQLQTAITSAPVLATPNFTRDFVIECDASRTGVGVVPMQSHRPIAVFSKSLAERWWGKSAYEKELMALAMAIQHWRPYLVGKKFQVRTNQHSLKHLLQHPIITPDQQNWVTKLLGYDFEIFYKPGKTNCAADELSQKTKNMELAVVFIPHWLDWEAIELVVREDLELHHIILTIEPTSTNHINFSLIARRLYHKGRIVLPVSFP